MIRQHNSRSDLLWFFPAVAIYGLLVWRFQFIQDDAYISYRYVANFLNGHGLVFNIGEQVEGYTNHGWVIILSLFGSLGVDFIAVSRILGFLCGAGLIWVAWKLAARVADQGTAGAELMAPYVVAASISLAYWSPAGLETSAFALAAAASLYWYVVRSPLLVFGLASAVWLRPEGALVAMILLVVEAVTERRMPSFSLRCGVMAFVVSLPMVGFKLSYYGSILPNPFYAKTGWDAAQFISGLEYVGEFFRHYPLAAFGLLGALVLYRKLDRRMRAVLWFSLLYSSYVALVGGDVLKVHRFMLPVLIPTAVLLGATVQALLAGLKASVAGTALVAATVLVAVITAAVPWEYVSNYNHRERLFVRKMALMADHMRQSDRTAFSVAAPTIGVFGYNLLGHTLIDMLGLTDSTIARHPESPTPGIASTWKERNYNSAYLLERSPDYIVFSTGIKPSAPAELVLTLYPQFQAAYRSVGWYFGLGDDGGGSLQTAYKRLRPVTGPLAPVYPAEFAVAYKQGIEAYNGGDFVAALGHFDRALKVSPRPYYLYSVYYRASCQLRLKQVAEGVRMMSWVVEQDSTLLDAQRELYLYYALQGDRARASSHREWIGRLTPWYLPRMDSLVARQVEAARRGRG